MAAPRRSLAVLDRSAALIAYLNTEFPSLSHTFIEREVRALRELGVEIQTYSVRAAGASGTLSEEHRRAAESTVVLHRGGSGLTAALLHACIASPVAAWRVLRAAMRLAPAGLHAKARHLAYAAEAVVLARDLKRRGIAHVHVHMANNGAAVALLACRFDPRLTYSLSIHGSAEFFHVDTWTLAPKVENALFTRCISHFCRAQVMAWTNPRCWERLGVVHCGIDVEKFTPVTLAASERLRLLTVGRLHPIKGYALLLLACAMLSRRGVDWSLDMVGDGPMRKELEDEAADLKIADRVTFSGAVGQDRIQQHYEQADVLVVSSFMEGVPVVMMEAMAKGCATLATTVGGILELLDGGKCGGLVSPGSAEALAAALEDYALGKVDLAELSAKGRARIQDKFNIKGTARRMRDAFTYYGVLPRTGPGRAPGKPSTEPDTKSKPVHA